MVKSLTPEVHDYTYRDFDYEKALKNGISPEQISEHLAEQRGFNLEKARQDGIDEMQIIEHLSKGEERSLPEKAGRMAMQAGLGAAEVATMPFDLAAQSLKSSDAQHVEYRGNIGEDIERLLEMKSMGIWDDQDQQLLEHLTEQLQDPSKAEPFVNTADITLRGVVEQATGIDTDAENLGEEIAHITGFIRDPKKSAPLLKKLGLSKSKILKTIIPTSKEVLRGTGMSIGLEAAKEGDFGPIGTLGMMVLGDLAGAGTGAVKDILKSPKKSLAKGFAKFTKSDQKAMQKEIIEEFRNQGMQADIGTITDSNIVRLIEAKLAQSGFTGAPLQEMKRNMIQEIKNAYGEVAEGLGQAKYTTANEAGSVLKEAIKEARKEDLKLIRGMYKEARSRLNKQSVVKPRNVETAMLILEEDLKEGSIKSSQQKEVLKQLNSLKGDIVDDKGFLKEVTVKTVLNNKIALNDIIDYEVQGGTKQLLKGLVEELDTAILDYGKNKDRQFFSAYTAANSRFARHAKTFRNKTLTRLMSQDNPERLLTMMDSIDGISNVEKALSGLQGGKELFNDMKRVKLDQMFQKSLVNNIEEQLKFGNFKNILQNPKNDAIARKLLDPKAYQRLKRIIKNSDKLQKSMTKFLNSSQSFTAAGDAAMILKLVKDIGHLLYGNPFPLAKSAAFVTGGRKLSKMMADPEFLKLVEDAIISGNKSPKELNKAMQRLLPYARELYSSESQSQE